MATIPLLVLVTGQKCTLKCKDCGNFAHLFKSLYNSKSILSDLEHFTEHIDLVNNLQLQGGEPLLHKDLINLIQTIRMNKKIKKITIASNGTIIPSDELIACMRENCVSIRISNYQNIANQDKIQTITHLLSKNLIKFKVYNFVTGNGSWIYLGDINRHRDDNNTVVANRFKSCPFNNCLSLENGIVARCSRALPASIAQGFNPGLNDYVIVNKIKDKSKLNTVITHYLNNPKFMTACRYCNGGNGALIDPALQLQPNNNDESTHTDTLYYI